MKRLGKYHPVDRDHLSRLMRVLTEQYPSYSWDVTLRLEGFLVTVEEVQKLAGHIGTLDPDYTEEDIDGIIHAAMLRQPRTVARLARADVPV